MIENNHRAEDPALCNRLEQQQIVAALGCRSGGEANPLEAMLDYRRVPQEELQASSAVQALGSTLSRCGAAQASARPASLAATISASWPVFTS